MNRSGRGVYAQVCTTLLSELVIFMLLTLGLFCRGVGLALMVSTCVWRCHSMYCLYLVGKTDYLKIVP